MDLFDDVSLNNLFLTMDRSVLSVEETLQLICSNSLSVSRFGDGELNYVLNSKVKSCSFQDPSEKLTEHLIKVLKSSSDKLLVCLPGAMYSSAYFLRYWKKKFPSLVDYFDLNSDKVYGSSFISRGASLNKKSNVYLWRKIWEKRKVVFVYGEGSRFDYMHEIFDNILTYDIIVSMSSNAYYDLERLISEVLEYDKDCLFLVSLGPTATILAHDISLLGYQIIDIGHITNCYDAIYHGGTAPEKLPVDSRVGNGE